MIKIGLQACSFAREFVKDPALTINTIAKSGYKYIESAGNMFDKNLHTPLKDVRKMLDDADVKHVSKHFTKPISHEAETLDREIRLMQTVGGKYLVLATDFYPDMNELKRNCDRFNAAGARLKAEGMVYLVHNHCHEMQHFGNKTVLELVAENTDPDLVKIEVDIMWTYRGGVNPWDILKSLGKRVLLLHVDDFCRKYGSFWEEVLETSRIDETLFSEKNIDTGMDIGDGKLDIQRSIDAALEHAAVDYGFIELSGTNTQFQGNLFDAGTYGLKKLSGYHGVNSL